MALRLCSQDGYLPVVAGLLLLLGTGLFGIGYWVGTSRPAVDGEMVEAWRSDLSAQQGELAEAREQAQAHINSLSLRIGQLQAHVLRLNALGQRLTKMANLDKGEFDFDQTPAVGGPADVPTESLPPETPDFLRSMDELASQLENREQQLSILETMMLHGNLQDQVHPAGRPVSAGWLSSYFGKRTDPFSGKPEYHNGVDFAGKMGSDVVAVAAGVVTWSGERYGYGNMVEIDHGNGYVTRYAHNQKNLVKVGETIKKGQQIALMGTSGRSTGPHVHFEVMRDGRTVDPTKYISAVRN